MQVSELECDESGNAAAVHDESAKLNETDDSGHNREVRHGSESALLPARGHVGAASRGTLPARGHVGAMLENWRATRGHVGAALPPQQVSQRGKLGQAKEIVRPKIL